MIRQVVSKPVRKYELTNDMRGQTFATKDGMTYLVVFAFESNKNNVYETFHHVVPLLGEKRANLGKVVSKTQLLKDYDVFVATTIDDSKKLIEDLIA